MKHTVHLLSPYACKTQTPTKMWNITIPSVAYFELKFLTIHFESTSDFQKVSKTIHTEDSHAPSFPRQTITSLYNRSPRVSIRKLTLLDTEQSVDTVPVTTSCPLMPRFHPTISPGRAPMFHCHTCSRLLPTGTVPQSVRTWTLEYWPLTL